MRHRVHTFKIGRSGAHRSAMLANMICSLIEHGQITTSLVKAKEARRVADKAVTMAKSDSLHHRRLLIARLQTRGEERKALVRKLVEEIAPKFAGRAGGYTRILKLGKRIGDATEMAILQWVEADAPKAADPVAEAPKAE
ncbi:MAG: 50S ribosomal protein L17 [Victivallaceae bacterium]|nr:50S ribosomal protein L17 [Victivallaceae bacterium]